MRPPEMLRTKSYEILHERLDEAANEGINAIVYGPPSSEKSFVLKNLCQQFRAAGRPVIYSYCGPRCTESFLYRGIAEAAGIPIRSSLRWACRYAVLNDLCARAVLPAIVLDEAQHLEIDALEGVRQIHDLTARDGRPGCGIILAGSHNLLREFLNPMRRARLEQTLSRFPHRVQLEGMSKHEILKLASQAFGNGKPAKLSEEQQRRLLERCSVDDPYFVGGDGKPAPRAYYSCRRLLEYIRQQKKNVKSILAEEVA
ncbi:MAG: ATP-binding protein [Candidatus Acidiferrum sp.]